MEQKPSVGRIVHVASGLGTTCAAIITAVNADGSINVTRFNPNGTTAAVLKLNKVHYLPKGEKDWNWPERT